RAHILGHEGHARRRRRHPAPAPQLSRVQLGRVRDPLYPRGAPLLEGGHADPGRAGGDGAALHDGVRSCGARRGPAHPWHAVRRVRRARPDHDAGPQQRVRQLLVVAVAGQVQRPGRGLHDSAADPAGVDYRLHPGRGDAGRRGRPGDGDLRHAVCEAGAGQPRPDRLVRPDRFAADGHDGGAGGPVVREVRPSVGGAELRGHADDLPVGHLLPDRQPARALRQPQQVQSLLLPDRRLPGWVHRPRGRKPGDRRGHERRAHRHHGRGLL
uniref:Efflux ABC transporter, permease protein n=1 Tax=Parastrongyloides trichosuri TaxID=131310 RepID=A0A0N5A2D2_PARTI